MISINEMEANKSNNSNPNIGPHSYNQ